MKKKWNNLGFTLIELLVAIAIIAVLSSSLFLILNPVEQFKKAHDAQRKNDFEQIRTALDTYYNDNNRYPDSLIEIAGYMPKVPNDPIGTSYCYQSDEGNSYILSTNLERDSDPQVIVPGVLCQSEEDTQSEEYNYAITSTNTSIIAYMIPPTLAPIPPTSTPITTTPTTIPPTPTPTSKPVDKICYLNGLPQTVDGAAATALGCTSGDEGCRRCIDGFCTYYTDGAFCPSAISPSAIGQHGCPDNYTCNISGWCVTRQFKKCNGYSSGWDYDGCYKRVMEPACISWCASRGGGGEVTVSSWYYYTSGYKIITAGMNWDNCSGTSSVTAVYDTTPHSFWRGGWACCDCNLYFARPQPTIPPTPTPTPTPPLPECRGWKYGSNCWYDGGAGESCTTVCGRHGSHPSPEDCDWPTVNDVSICQHFNPTYYSLGNTLNWGPTTVGSGCYGYSGNNATCNNYPLRRRQCSCQW